MSVDKIVDPNRTLQLRDPYNAISWKSVDGPVKLTLDLGEVCDIGAFRLVGTLPPGLLAEILLD